MTETGWRVTYAIGGAIVGALILYGALKLAQAAEDEDRPPIIVKNGSMIFESGDSDSNDPDEKNGKPWQSVDGDWQPDHRSGKKLKGFIVRIAGPGSCPILSMTRELTVTYTNQDGTQTDFVIRSKPRPGSKTDAPAVTGPGLAPDNSGANPRLIAGTPGQGRISRVRFQAQGTGSVDCSDPTKLKIWQQ